MNAEGKAFQKDSVKLCDCLPACTSTLPFQEIRTQMTIVFPLGLSYDVEASQSDYDLANVHTKSKHHRTFRPEK